ncbi:hypothetical protein STSO111631_09900 [Stackebrandtia soli]
MKPQLNTVCGVICVRYLYNTTPSIDRDPSNDQQRNTRFHTPLTSLYRGRHPSVNFVDYFRHFDSDR